MQSDLHQAGEAVFSLVAQSYSWGIQITDEKKIAKKLWQFFQWGDKRQYVFKFAFYNGVCFY